MSMRQRTPATKAVEAPAVVPASVRSIGASSSGGWWAKHGDTACLVFLFVLAAVSRFWRLHDPKGIIFDEVRVR